MSYRQTHADGTPEWYLANGSLVQALPDSLDSAVRVYEKGQLIELWQGTADDAEDLGRALIEAAEEARK